MVYRKTENPLHTVSFDLITVREFCTEARISRSSWQKLKRQGQTPPIISIGGSQRIRRESVEAWLVENEDRAAADAAHKAAEACDPLVILNNT